MKHTVTLIAGEGIGPELAVAARRVIDASGVEITWEEVQARAEVERRGGGMMRDEAVASVRKNRYALKGPMATPIAEGPPSINVGLRKALDLYANLRPVKNIPFVPSRFENVDLVVVRENTEDLYSGLEHVIVPGVVESLKIITEKASTRIGKFAFDYARKHGRKKVAVVHKANIMKLSDGLFLQCFRNVSKEYPNVIADDKIVDNLCMQMVTDPQQFDILLLENLYGDIVSDLAAGLVGGLGVVAGANIGESGAIFEAVHGSAPDIAGQNKANPLAMLKSAVLMLHHIGEMGPAQRIEEAIVKVLDSGPEHRTRDIGGTGTTADFTTAMCETLRRGARASG